MNFKKLGFSLLLVFAVTSLAGVESKQRRYKVPVRRVKNDGQKVRSDSILQYLGIKRRTTTPYPYYYPYPYPYPELTTTTTTTAAPLTTTITTAVAAPTVLPATVGTGTGTPVIVTTGINPSLIAGVTPVTSGFTTGSLPGTPIIVTGRQKPEKEAIKYVEENDESVLQAYKLRKTHLLKQKRSQIVPKFQTINLRKMVRKRKKSKNSNIPKRKSKSTLKKRRARKQL